MRISDWSSDVCSSDRRRRVRRQQYRGVRDSGRRYDGPARRRDSQRGRISDRRQPRRTRAAVGAHHDKNSGTGDGVNYVIRAAKPGDLQSIYEMAKLTGGGFTNLPPDRQALRAKLERAEAGFASEKEYPGDELYLMVLEELDRSEAQTAELQ